MPKKAVSQSAARSRKKPAARSGTRRPTRKSNPVMSEVKYLSAAAFGILLLLSMFIEGSAGFVGRFIESLLTGFFGFGGYVLPFAVLGVALYGLFTKLRQVPSPLIVKSSVILWCVISFLHLLSASEMGAYDNVLGYFQALYQSGAVYNGGLFGALLGNLLRSMLGNVGAYIVLLLGGIITLVLLSGRSFVSVVSTCAKWVHYNLSRSEFLEANEEACEEEYEEAWEEAPAMARRPRELRPLPARPDRKRRTDKPKELLVIKDVPVKPPGKILLVQEEVAENKPPHPVFVRRRPAEAEARAPEPTSKPEPEPEPIPDPVPEPAPLFAPRKPFPRPLSASSITIKGLTAAKPAVSPPALVLEDDLPAPLEGTIDETFEQSLEGTIDETFAQSLEGVIDETLEQTLEESIGEPFDEYLDDSLSEPFAESLEENLAEAFEAHFDELFAETDEPLEEESEPIDESIARKLMSFPSPSRSKKKATPAALAKQPVAVASDTLASALPRYENYQFPPITLLTKSQPVNTTGSSAHILENSRILEETLKSFRVEAKVVEVSVGPTVTRYDLSPGVGVKVSSIANLSNDLALSLAAQGIRIEAPIPGKAAVGIEVPNKDPQPVLLREIIEDESFQKFPSKLAFSVGKDIAGEPVVTDVGRMPHLLIAGATGSGKSVCINTLIASILYKARPDEVKLLMIDPKVVELSVYNGIPHLLIPVVTDPKKASGALQWAVSEMDNRYGLFAEAGVRELKSYNAFLAAKRSESAESEESTGALPQIVIIIDELADLMMVCKGEVEESICRLAQKARAAGIHLIVATQRPSVDVITGLIKANIPSRLAFAVSSGTDSRTVLDMYGAEKLLGKGDMLFLPMGKSKPIRLQGGYISDKEVENVVDFLKTQTVTVYPPEMIEKVTAQNQAGGGEDLDEYFLDAVEFLLEKGRASVSMLQRQFRIGYNRASRLMEDLENHGVVGPEDGIKPRKILITWEEYEARYSGST